MNRPLRVFLCHSSNDKPAVRELYQKLRAEPWIQPWLDEEELLPGQDWDMEIEKAVDFADVVIVCLSINSVTKEGYIQKEIKKALDKADEKPERTIYIIPLCLEKCNVPSRLSKWQWVDFYKPNAFKKLIKALRSRATSLRLGQQEMDLEVLAILQPHTKTLGEYKNIFSWFRRRSIAGLELGEKLLVTFKAIDLQIAWIQNQIHNASKPDIDRPIRLCSRYIVASLIDCLGLDNTHKTKAYLLVVAEDNKFKLIAFNDIDEQAANQIESTFHYGSNADSLAGFAVNQKHPIVINDLSDSKNVLVRDWIHLYPGDNKKTGSVLVYPIVDSFLESDTEPSAILCIHSERNDAFTQIDSILRLMTYFSVKLEIVVGLLKS